MDRATEVHRSAGSAGGKFQGRRTSSGARAAFQLNQYTSPPPSGIDLSLHKGGQEGYDKIISNFAADFPSLERDHAELTEKVVVVGDSNVGKTCLILRFCNDTYRDDYKSTIGVDFFWQKYLAQGFDFTLHVWDTAGQERFRSLSQAYYRGARAALIAFDLGVQDTFLHTKQWVSEVLKENRQFTRQPGDFCLFLIGLKADMFHVVTRGEGEQLAREIHAEYFEVSAKTGDGVSSLFDRVACVLVERALKRTADGLRVDKNEDSACCTTCAVAVPKVASPGNPRKKKVAPIVGGGKGIGDGTGGGKGMEDWKHHKGAAAAAGAGTQTAGVIKLTEPVSDPTVGVGKKKISCCSG